MARSLLRRNNVAARAAGATSSDRLWPSPPVEVIRRRLKRPQALGMTDRRNSLEILERGRHL